MSATGQTESFRSPALRAPHSRFEPDGAEGAHTRSGQRIASHELHAALARQQSRRGEPLEQPGGEIAQIVRSLSHDLSAMFMLLEHSLERLKDAAEPLAAKPIAPAATTAMTAADPKAEGPIAPLAQQFAHVEACMRESKRFLDDLSAVARTGRMHMEPEQVELATIVAEVLFEQRELLAERNIAFDIAADLPAVWCNPCRVKQVFTNLVRNAARHGCDPQQPRISISRYAAADPSDNAFASIAIYDNGAGIPAEFRETVFEPGRRLPCAHPEGTGMGLAIVRKIVEYYGGLVFVEPAAGGATFVVSLPKATAANTPGESR